MHTRPQLPDKQRKGRELDQGDSSMWGLTKHWPTITTDFLLFSQPQEQTRMQPRVPVRRRALTRHYVALSRQNESPQSRHRPAAICLRVPRDGDDAR